MSLDFEYGVPSLTSSCKLDLELRMPYTWTHSRKHWGQYPAERHKEISETSEAQKLC